MQFIITVFEFEGCGETGADKPVASFGPFSEADATNFARQNMGALATGYYWEQSEHFKRPMSVPGLFIKGTRNNPKE